MVKLLSWFILLYKKRLSPFLGSHCRFYPSCSSYFLESLRTHGAFKGSLLGIWRICRCNPLSDGGIDPVPEAICSHTSHHSPEEVKKESGISHGY